MLKKVLEILKGTFDSTWEGPMRVTKCLPNGAYELEDPDDTSTQYPQNVVHLNKYYQQATSPYTLYHELYC